MTVNITATSETAPTEIAVFKTGYQNVDSSNVWYAVRLIGWVGAAENGKTPFYYKWQKGDAGVYHARYGYMCDYNVVYDGTTSTVNFSLDYSSGGWTDCCSTQRMDITNRSGSMTLTGNKFVSGNAVSRFSETIDVSFDNVPAAPSADAGTPEEIPVVNDELSRYRIYANNALIYNPWIPQYILIEPRLTQEVNQADLCSFTIPPVHDWYDGSENRIISKFKTTIEVREGSEVIFRGRVINTETDIDAQRKVEASGALAYLNDTEFHSHKFEGSAADLFKQVIDSHTEQAQSDPYRTLVYGTCDITSTVVSENESPCQSWDVISSILDQTKGYLKLEYLDDGRTKISLVASFNHACAQPVWYGDNLLDITISEKEPDEMYTGIRGLGKSKDNTRPQTDIIWDDTAVQQYGKILHIATYSDIESVSELEKAAKKDLAEHCKNETVIEAQIFDKNLIDKTQMKFRLGDSVQVISPKHNLNGWYLLTKRDLRLDSPGESEYTLGKGTTAASDQIANAQRTRRYVAKVENNTGTNAEAITNPEIDDVTG